MALKSLKCVVASGLIIATLMLAVPTEAATVDQELSSRIELQTSRIEARRSLAGILDWVLNTIFAVVPRGGSKLDPNG